MSYIPFHRSILTNETVSKCIVDKFRVNLGNVAGNILVWRFDFKKSMTTIRNASIAGLATVVGPGALEALDPARGEWDVSTRGKRMTVQLLPDSSRLLQVLEKK